MLFESYEHFHLQTMVGGTDGRTDSHNDYGTHVCRAILICCIGTIERFGEYILEQSVSLSQK